MVGLLVGLAFAKNRVLVNVMERRKMYREIMDVIVRLGIMIFSLLRFRYRARLEMFSRKGTSSLESNNLIEGTALCVLMDWMSNF